MQPHRHMPGYTRESGNTLDVVAVCVNRIGMIQPTNYVEPRPHHLTSNNKKLSPIVVVPESVAGSTFAFTGELESMSREAAVEAVGASPTSRIRGFLKGALEP